MYAKRLAKRLLKDLDGILMELKNVSKDIHKFDRSSGIPLMERVGDISSYVSYIDDLCSRTERICQLILTNPEVLDQVKWENDEEREKFINNLHHTLYVVDFYRQNSLGLKQTIVIASALMV